MWWRICYMTIHVFQICFDKIWSDLKFCLSSTFVTRPEFHIILTKPKYLSNSIENFEWMFVSIYISLSYKREQLSKFSLGINLRMLY